MVERETNGRQQAENNAETKQPGTAAGESRLIQGLLCLFTFFLVGVGALQWCTLEKTDQTLKAQQRAWLAPHHPVLEKEIDVNEGQELKYAIFYGNAGKEPAINIVIQQTEEAPILFKNASTESLFAQNKIEKFDCAVSHPNSGGFGVFPTTSPELTYEVHVGKPLPNEKGIRSGANFLLIRGCFGYETVREPHYSWFCYFWPQISAPALWQLCPRGTNGAN
jgi:hypothetical protein